MPFIPHEDEPDEVARWLFEEHMHALEEEHMAMLECVAFPEEEPDGED